MQLFIHETGDKSNRHVRAMNADGTEEYRVLATRCHAGCKTVYVRDGHGQVYRGRSQSSVFSNVLDVRPFDGIINRGR